MEPVHRDGDYQCGECDFTAIKMKELKSHMVAGHRSQGWLYQCDECEFAAVKRKELKSHMEVVHKDVNKNVEVMMSLLKLKMIIMIMLNSLL